MCGSVIPQWFVYLCVCVFQREIEREQKAENTVTHSSVDGTVKVCVYVRV